MGIVLYFITLNAWALLVYMLREVVILIADQDSDWKYVLIPLAICVLWLFAYYYY